LASFSLLDFITASGFDRYEWKNGTYDYAAGM